MQAYCALVSGRVRRAVPKHIQGKLQHLSAPKRRLSVAFAKVYSVHCEGVFGGPDRDRTDDLFHAMEARSQLRHRPTASTITGLGRKVNGPPFWASPSPLSRSNANVRRARSSRADHGPSSPGPKMRGDVGVQGILPVPRHNASHPSADTLRAMRSPGVAGADGVPPEAAVALHERKPELPQCLARRPSHFRQAPQPTLPVREFSSFLSSASVPSFRHRLDEQRHASTA